jgi:hypothetical protein
MELVSPKRPPPPIPSVKPPRRRPLLPPPPIPSVKPPPRPIYGPNTAMTTIQKNMARRKAELNSMRPNAKNPIFRNATVVMQEEQMRGQNKGIPPYLNYLGKMHGQNRVSSVLNAKKSIQGYIKKRINNTQKKCSTKKIF